jgi:hypothetical protein
LTLRLR